MFCQRLRKFLFAGALLAVTPFASQAADATPEPIAAPSVQLTGHKGDGCCNPAPACAPAACAPAACAPAAPTTCKVRVCEMVQEQRQVVCTSYKNECRTETYTAYRCETVQEQQQRQVTVYKKVCETVMKPKTVCVKVPCVQTVTEMKTCWKKVQVTEMKTRCVDKGHYECREVPVGPSLLERLCHKKDCCDPCPPCPKTKTVKCWVPNMVTECYPVCRTKHVKECVPVTRQVCTYKTETRTEMVPCTVTRCVPECKTETVTVCKKVQVPYQATRTVNVCVPVQETKTVTVCVPRWTEKEVPVAPACQTACQPACDDACSSACGSGGFFSRLRHKKSCDSGCSAPAANCCN